MGDVSCELNLMPDPRSKSQSLTGHSWSSYSQRTFSGFKSRWAMPTQINAIHEYGSIRTIFFQKRGICNFLTFLMQELQSRGQITNDITSLLFGKSHSILNMIQQLSSMNLFKDEVEPVSLFKILNQLDDVLMASAMMKGFNLFENTRSRVSRDFICKNNVKIGEKGLLEIIPKLTYRWF